ncbi:MAG: methyltransferase domain-containing protein, partial [Candidatus Edwardsbacteria bacterium]|nr:methyltransferase domain-containing protein [Candidatus Edwardsbacteria bacterium]
MRSKPRTKKIDWSKKRWKKMLVDQRKFLWYPESIAMFAKWAGLKPGMTVADAGCGLGYMGYTYWPHFGKGGLYIGVDLSHKLLVRARKDSQIWARPGMARFARGDARRLPFPENSMDAVMCQTLLMHLIDPQAAVAEMARILKPGGIMLCHEPDNLSSSMTRGYSEKSELSIAEEAFLHKINLHLHKGRLQCGRGDSSIGNKVPVLMKKAGLKDIGIRMNDKAYFLLPPYDDDVQRHLISEARKYQKDA